MTEPLSREARAWRTIALIAMGLLVFVLMIESVQLPRTGKPAPEEPESDLPQISFKRISFADLPGWQEDQHAEALAPFVRSCEKMTARKPDAAMNPREALGVPDASLSGTVGDWAFACARAGSLLRTEMAQSMARGFFESYFVPMQISQPAVPGDGPPEMTHEGLFTGYFEPAYQASRSETEEYSAPVLARPDDLVMVDLGAFREELAGKRIAGRVSQGSLLPYADHEEIMNGALDTETIAWMNPNDLLFLQIQGSGRLQFEDGEIRVGYAAQNGHAYTAIGGPLIRSGEIAREDMSMQAIYQWLDAASTEDAAALRYVNKSYVFFRLLDNLPSPGLGPVGASGIQLTPGRSLAVDRRFHALGVPVWIGFDGLEPDTQERRLVIAQDTGGAIKGPVRGDLFIGSGQQAGEIAGRMRQAGELYTLVPIAVAQRLEAGREQAQAK